VHRIAGFVTVIRQELISCPKRSSSTACEIIANVTAGGEN